MDVKCRLNNFTFTTAELSAIRMFPKVLLLRRFLPKAVISIGFQSVLLQLKNNSDCLFVQESLTPALL